MANAKEIKRKIGSIKNTWKITKAMELISTVKMKKAQDLALSKRDFVLEMLKIFIRVEEYLNDFPLFRENSSDKTLWVIITSNKWLCGGYNINVMKKVNSYMKENGDNMDFVTVWKKASQFVARTGNNLIADFSEDFSDNVEPIFTKEISKVLRDEFLTGKYNRVVVFYNYYVNTIKQVPVAKVSLPIDAKGIKDYLVKTLEHQDVDVEKEIADSKDIFNYDLEPSPESLANEVIPMILDMILFDTLLEAKASEHSSRMIAMKNAKDSAKKISDRLTLAFNKARQAMITREVSEITAWVESMKDV